MVLLNSYPALWVSDISNKLYLKSNHLMEILLFQNNCLVVELIHAN